MAGDRPSGRQRGEMSVVLEAISPESIREIAVFLHHNLNTRVAAATWTQATDVGWATAQPNHGFALRSEGRIVGALLAFYSERERNGRMHRICNLGAWCVLPEFRFHSVRLLRRALAQDGYTFTDLSPSGPVVALNTRLGFSTLDTTTALYPCLPHLSVGRTQVVTDLSRIQNHLQSPERRIFEDHRSALAAHHVAIVRPEGICYVIYRRDRRKGLPVFASVLYTSNRDVFSAGVAALAATLARTRGVAALLVEERVAGRLGRSLTLRQPRPKMFLSNSLDAAEIDYLYSELCCVAW
jgi:hypothetical protein